MICILFFTLYLYFKVVRKRYRATDDSEGLMTARIEENLSSVRIVKAFNNEKFEIDNFETYLQDYRSKFIKWRKVSSFFFSSSDIFVFSQITLATIISIVLCVYGEITYATVIVAFSYVSMIVWPIRDVATTLSNFARVLAALERIRLLLDIPVEDLKSGLTPKITGEIEFKNVSFKFPDADNYVLKNVSFKIKKGQTVAIMGKTGSGKSTLMLLLTRLYDIESGEITGKSIETTDKIPAIAFDGVCCANDFAAFGVIRGLADYGIHVPQDVKVIGFDGVTSGTYTTPSLSTIQVDLDQLAKFAVDMIVERIERGEVNGNSSNAGNSNGRTDVGLIQAQSRRR